VFFSYELGVAKPDFTVFQRAIGVLTKDNIMPDDCVMVGNSLVNDVAPAQHMGFRTVLFAPEAVARVRHQTRSGDPQPRPVAGMAVRLAILHYHLRPGGVTTVIRNSQRALADRFDVTVLADFGYDDRPARSQARISRRGDLLARRLQDRLKGVDVLHTHNIGLGKHPRLTCAVKLLAKRLGTIQVINQVHDFPEDARPAQLRALRDTAPANPTTCSGTGDLLLRPRRM
jgi:hypothetical protein